MTDPARNPASPTVTPLRPPEECAPDVGATLREHLQHECDAMLRHALDIDKEIPPDTARRAGQVLAVAAPGKNEADRLAELTTLHNELSALIAPASGRTLVLMEGERKSHPVLYVFGPLRLVRQMLAFAVAALLCTTLLSTLTIVNVDNIAVGWFDLSGTQATCVLAFLLSVAALGAAFSNLSTINRYIEQANFDPKYEGSYWVRIVLGMISGVVLGEILFDLLVQVQSVNANALARASERVVMVFLGGFATAPVQRLLTNLSDAVGTLLQGRYASAAQRPAARSKPAGGEPQPAKAEAKNS